MVEGLGVRRNGRMDGKMETTKSKIGFRASNV